MAASGAPQFKSGLSDVVAEAGSSASFDAVLSSDPPAQVKWLLNGRPAPKDVLVSLALLPLLLPTRQAGGVRCRGAGGG